MKNKGMVFGSLAGAVLLIGLDQIIKTWAARVLRAVSDIQVIPGVLHLLYRENFGAAFSILQNRTVLLVGVTSVVLILLLVALLTGRIREPILIGALSLVLAGGTGNLIDRILRGYVVDYIYFVPIDFPVFNLADCCVVCGTLLFVVYLLVIEPRRARNEQDE